MERSRIPSTRATPESQADPQAFFLIELEEHLDLASVELADALTDEHD
jgi:hypothetical protein